MTAPQVVDAAGADADLLLAAADIYLEVARHEALPVLEAAGPREGVAAALRAGLEPGADVILAVEPGRGLALCGLPTDANLDRASVEAYVLPDGRRRGTGRRLTAAVVAEAVARGRVVADVAAPVDSLVDVLVAALPGITLATTDRESVWHCDERTLELARQARREASGHAGDYELVAWLGPCPPEHVEGLGAVMAAMADAPLGDSTWTFPPAGPDAVRRADGHAAAAGLNHHTVIAVHRRSGEVAGFTDVAVWPGHDRGEQWDTGVVRAHRGHRLGLLLKASMALRLAEHEPALRVLHTWNNDENAHMLAVNERLGWRPAAMWHQYEGPLTAFLDDAVLEAER